MAIPYLVIPSSFLPGAAVSARTSPGANSTRDRGPLPEAPATTDFRISPSRAAGSGIIGFWRTPGLTEQEYRSILIPNQPFRRLKIADYISQGKKKKLFKGEYIRTSAKTIDDLYYYYIDEGQIVATFEQESGEVAPLFWRNAGNAFSAEYNDYASIGRYKARFIAAQNTVLFAFTQRQLYELSQDDPELFYEFINVCHMSFAQMGHRISNTGYQSSTKRMIMWLQKLCATQECDEHGVYDIECKLTLQQLSELLSIHITTCTKIVAALENEGVIERTRTRIRIFDAQRLAQYGLEDTPLAY